MQWIIWMVLILDLIRRGMGEVAVKPSPENLKPAASPGNALFADPDEIQGPLGHLFLSAFDDHMKLARKLTRRDLLVISTVGKYGTNFNVYCVHNDRNGRRARTIFDPLTRKRGEFRWLYVQVGMHSAQKVYDWYPVTLDNSRLLFDSTNPLLSFEIQHPPKLHDYFESRRVGFY